MPVPAATINEFNRLSDKVREKQVALLKFLHAQGLTCHVGSVGREIHITVGPAMAAASYWLHRYDIEF